MYRFNLPIKIEFTKILILIKHTKRKYAQSTSLVQKTPKIKDMLVLR